MDYKKAGVDIEASYESNRISERTYQKWIGAQ